MNKNTIDLLNTLDDYKDGVELSNHKDPYVKNKYDSISQIRGYNYAFLILIAFFALISINFVLLAKTWDFFKVIEFTLKQLIYLVFFSYFCISLYQRNQRKILMQDTKKNGNPYIEEIKEYYFYNEDIRNLILDDFKKLIKIDNKVLMAIDKGCLETSDLFGLQIEIEKKFKKTLIMKMLNIENELEKQKKNRKKELWQQYQIEEGTKELRKHFLKDNK